MSQTVMTRTEEVAYSSLRCAFCKRYLFIQPRQASCGDRICGECFERLEGLQNSAKGDPVCPACGTEVVLAKCFRDKAVEMELANTVIKCTNPNCPWEGESQHFQDHTLSCKYAVTECPNKGCGAKLYRNELQEHLSQCKFMPVPCHYCGKKMPLHVLENHMKKDCGEVVVLCFSECGQKFLRKDLTKHLAVCTLQLHDCEYKEMGCRFRGNARDLEKHEAHTIVYHLQLLKQQVHSNQKHEPLPESTATDDKLQMLDQQVVALKNDIAKIKSEMSFKLQPMVDAMVKVESAIQQLQEGFAEVALMTQTLQATSYSGTIVWKIPEVQRRRQEAEIGKTISLYSAPFYTGRHGYKVCLRLYMDGDGSGKGSHLSFFLTVMRGEFDALLPWPLKQTVTLMLLDQDRQRDIVQSFRPEPTSSSFQRPQNEMNVASGCPLFAPLSILNNPSYVKDDTMFLKCVIDTNGLDHT